MSKREPSTITSSSSHAQTNNNGGLTKRTATADETKNIATRNFFGSLHGVDDGITDTAHKFKRTGQPTASVSGPQIVLVIKNQVGIAVVVAKGKRSLDKLLRDNGIKISRSSIPSLIKISKGNNKCLNVATIEVMPESEMIENGLEFGFQNNDAGQTFKIEQQNINRNAHTTADKNAVLYSTLYNPSGELVFCSCLLAVRAAGGHGFVDLLRNAGVVISREQEKILHRNPNTVNQALTGGDLEGCTFKVEKLADLPPTNELHIVQTKAGQTWASGLSGSTKGGTPVTLHVYKETIEGGLFSASRKVCHERVAGVNPASSPFEACRLIGCNNDTRKIGKVKELLKNKGLDTKGHHMTGYNWVDASAAVASKGAKIVHKNVQYIIMGSVSNKEVSAED